MAVINILDRETAELIAAGEVIERPSSVVKELVENAIDAGAAAVTVEIRNGGVRLIRVTDNGSGIEREEVPKAFLRHATSKVMSPEDLDHIGTLGFRGEALASICAVSKVELLTRASGEEIGTRYTLAGECAGELAEAGCPKGTTITACDLFYNVPARLKFLKKDSTEGAAIAALMDRLALSHPDVSFKLISNGELKMNTPGDGKLLAAIYAVYGNEFGRSLIPVDCTVGSMHVEGYLARPECCRSSRSMEHFFINHRYVKSMTMLAAVEEAYRNHLMVGKFPGCVINLTLNPALIDVNVHPAKLEVKLSDERGVFDTVFSACKGALSEMPRAVPAADVAGRKFNSFTLNHRPDEGAQTHLSAQEYRAMAKECEPSARTFAGNGNSALPRKLSSSPESRPISAFGSAAAESYRAGLPQKGTPYGASSRFTEEAPRSDTVNTALPAASRMEREPVLAGSAAYVGEAFSAAARKKEDYACECASDFDDTASQAKEGAPDRATGRENPSSQWEAPNIRLLGEIFSTYLIAEKGDKMLLIDQHAAHERLLFDRLLGQHRQGGVQRQILLAPLAVTMTKDLYDASLRHIGDFSAAGFLVEDFGSGCLRVREIPAVLMQDNVSDLILELAERFLQNIGGGEALFDDLYHSVACKAAVKGNQPLSQPEQQELLRLLEENPTVRNCPHGRPVMIEMTKKEIEKMFGRIV